MMTFKIPVISLSCLPFILSFCFVLTACSSTSSDIGKPVPELTYQYVEPYRIDVATIEVKNNFDPTSGTGETFSDFPTPPDIALRRYAENRFLATGENGILNFVIENASIHHSYVEPEAALAKWLNKNGKDRYDAKINLRLYTSPVATYREPHSLLSLERSLILPSGLSLAERETAQLEFLELLMQDVDLAVLQALEKNLNLTVTGTRPPMDILSSPEVRGEQDK